MIQKLISSFSARFVLDTDLMDLPSALMATDALVICELPGKLCYLVPGLHMFGPQEMDINNNHQLPDHYFISSPNMEMGS